IVLIAVLALLFVGPDKLPQTARSIGKGIRDFRKQTKDLQDTIEKDAQIGEAVRELRSALRGEPELKLPPKPKSEPVAKALGPTAAGAADKAAEADAASEPGASAAAAPTGASTAAAPPSASTAAAPTSASTAAAPTSAAKPATPPAPT